MPPEEAATPPTTPSAGTPPPAAPESNAAPAAPPPASSGASDWRAGLPQELRDALGDADPAEAATTYARGKEYVPAQKAEDIALDLGKDAALHPGLEKLFKDMCIAQKMTPGQAQAVAEFHGRFSAEAQRLYLEHGNAQLEQRFGADTGKVKDNALKAFALLDRKMDGRLSASQDGRQIASSPLAVEALYHVFQMFGEDALGANAPSGGEDRAMSDRDFFEHVFNKQTQGARTPL